MDKQSLEKLISEGKSQREISDHFKCSQSTVRNYLKKFNLKTFAKSKYDILKEKQCGKCKQNKFIEEFYPRKRGGYSGYCKKCSNANSSIRQKNVSIERKKQLVEEFGGGCKICGYNKCIAALDFHHIDPEQKISTLSARELGNNSWEFVRQEIKKCQLLCSNCHRELHYNEESEKYKSELKNEQNKTRNINKVKKIKICDCGSAKLGKSKKCKTCFHNRKSNYPPLQELLDSVKNNGYRATGRKYGVSDNCIRKWLKNHYKIDLKNI